MLQVTLVNAPERPAISSKAITIFLAGTTTPTGERDWRDALISKIHGFPVPGDETCTTNIVILNPFRADWDSNFKGDAQAEQIAWEIDMQEAADHIVVCFQDVTDAPISLLELGLAARPGKAVVCAAPGYSKRLNVEVVCGRFGVPLTDDMSDLANILCNKVCQRAGSVRESGQ